MSKNFQEFLNEPITHKVNVPEVELAIALLESEGAIKHKSAEGRMAHNMIKAYIEQNNLI